MGFGTENHGLNLQFTSGLFRQVEWPINRLVYSSRWSVYASGHLDKFHCTIINNFCV